MDDKPWFDAYDGQTTEELIALARRHRTDSIVLAFEEALLRKLGHIGPPAMTEAEITVLAVEALEREVNNGGYDQFLVNSSPVIRAAVVEALERVGCPGVARITREALDTINSPDAERDGKLSALDTRYYTEAGDLAGPLFKYIKANRDAIKIRRQ